MKSRILLHAIGVSLLCVAALPGWAQKGGGASVGTPSAGGGTQQQPPTAGSAGADVNDSAIATTPGNNPQLAATNAAPGIPASPGTNANGSQAGQPLSPTSQIGATNAVYPTNSAANTTPEWLQRDQAITEQDRAMLMQMRQAAFQGQPLSGWMHSIHFILKDGAVRIVGTVPSLAERQRIETIVTQIPGVVKVYDALAVNPSAGADAGAANASANVHGSTLPPTSFAPTNIGGHVPPDSKFTNIIYETAPQPAPPK
jgi:BON domain